MNVQELRYVVAVAQAGSINKAALNLYVSQSTLSRAVQEVEAQIGISLFQRTNKGAIPTHDGLEFIERARRLLLAFDQLEGQYFNHEKAEQETLLVATQRCTPVISAFIEYYQKRTKDLLNTVSVAAGSNFTNMITANVGSMKNEGLEFNINAVAIQTKDFSWELGYNVTWNTSKITKLTATYNPDYEGINAGSASYGSGTVLQKHQVGYAPSTYWLFQQVYDENGKPVQNAVVDRNNDGQITNDDRYMTKKSPMADVYMGLSSQFTYKNWDLGFNLRASIGNYVYNASAADNGSLNAFSNQGFITNYYKSAVESTGFTLTSSTEQKASDLFLENASFLKMDNITLGYTFKNLFTSKLSGRISASVQNVFTITKYSGLDPECNAIDQSLWPRPRTFSLGINLNF